MGSNSGKFEQSISQGWYTYRIEWRVGDDSNTIICEHWLDVTQALHVYSRKVSCTINSVVQEFMAPAISTSGSQKSFALGTTTHTITRSESGAASFSISSVYPIQARISGVYFDSIYINGSATLEDTTVPSTLTYPSFIIGKTSDNIKIENKNASCVHTLRYVFGSEKGIVGTEKMPVRELTWNVPLSLAEQIPSSYSGTGKFILETYLDDTKIGEREYAFNAIVEKDDPDPSVDEKPIVGTISAVAIDGSEIYLQGRTQLEFTITNSVGSYNSDIAEYRIVGGGIAVSSRVNKIVLPAIQLSGTISFNVSVIDTRGAISDAKPFSATYYEYFQPTITKFSVVRDSKTGDITCSYNTRYATVGNNKIEAFIYVKESGKEESVVTNYGGSADNLILATETDINVGYTVHMVVYDDYNGTAKSNTQTIFGKSRTLNFNKYNTGVAVGKISTATKDSPLFEVAWDSNFDRNVVINGDLTVNGTINGIADYVIDSYVDGNWTVHVWKSNIIEVFATLSGVTKKDSVVNNMGLYTGSTSFPNGLFMYTPNIWYNVKIGNAITMTANAETSNAGTFKWGALTLGDTSDAEQAYSINVHAIGKGLTYEPTTATDYLYTIENNEVTIIGYRGTSVAPIIPDTIEGKPVTIIGENCFSDLNIVAVKIPSSVKIIN